MTECSYSPQISPGNNALTPISATQPVLTPISTVIFSYPYVSPTTTVTLRTPRLGNTEALQLKRIVNVSRGNRVWILRNQNWPKMAIHNLEFVLIAESVINTLKTFLLASLGKEVGYLDYESRQWKGIITNPNEAIEEQVQGGCGYTVRIIFEGELA